jgi:hypothetical protein
MASLTGQDLLDRQYDILWQSIEGNPKLAYSPVPSLDRSLKTTNKRIIKALNELKDGLALNQTGVDEFNVRMRDEIGDTRSFPELVTNLKKVDGNVLSAIFKIYRSIIEDPDNPIDISDIGDSVNGALLNLNAKIEEYFFEPENKIYYPNFHEDYKLIPEPNSPLVTKFKAKDRTLRMYVNGIFYDHLKHYSYNPDTRVLNWTFTEENGGFDLTDDFSVTLVYDVDYKQNGISSRNHFEFLAGRPTATEPAPAQ